MSKQFKDVKDYDYSEFNILEQIGEGAYGKIYKAKWKEEKIALKLSKPNRDKKYIIKEMILNKEETNDIQFDYFVSKDNEPILHEEEPNISLESILRPSIKIFDLTDEQKEVCMCELDILCSRNLITYNNSILPWLSIFLGKSKEEASNQILKNQIITEIFFTKLKRTEIFISREDIILEEEFRKKIEMALSSCKNYHEMINKLREIAKEYGWFYARHFVFGGAIIKETNTRNSVNSYSRNVGGDLGNKSTFMSFADSLKDFEKWKIIEYNDICPIFDILDDDLRKKVLDVLAGIKQIFPLNHFSKKISYIYSLSQHLEELSKITNIQETFVIGSHIISSSNSACIFVHDLKGKVINDDELLQRLKLVFCTIETNQECNAGQLDIKWIESKNESNVFHGTEKENVDVFPGNKNIGQTDILNNEKLILVNQLFENCCNHGFLNVNSNEIIYKALNTPSLESEKMEYFLVKL
ncbi:37061_t:CDS:2 [Gigaspora margarita]|uniref:37061_t:CDS:1 n=1 Tax=Gigaspora margarita TaxID=4874 RepID=A0ABN7UI28_GIGMA|nr:37061_t:CDS:2 [Gigaspora margarita]